jgi:arylsulfatase A-like enzyme
VWRIADLRRKSVIRHTHFAQGGVGLVGDGHARTQLLKRWDTLNDEEKKLFIRQANVYAAYLAYTDHEIGRVIQAVADLGKLDNTLIRYISGDNGASAEGSPNGTPSEVLQFNGIELPVPEQMKFYDVWGSDLAGPGCSVPVHHHLLGPIRPTRRHAPISPHCGLYAAPSLCRPVPA